ncbi:MAG: Cof-type HAD-IIB family hydrolase [Clostridiales bacterium]|nr:Cof-type HAD-IIB family hydrolase [Clostridiales bacterium]
MKIDTIVTDMDDTLLDANGKISDYTLRVVKECVARGLRFIPASGRTQSSLRPFVEQMGTGCPYIGGNGSEIIGADHQLLEQQTLDAETARQICAFLREHGFYVHVYHDDAFYYDDECTAATNYKHSSGMRGIAVGDLVSFIDFDTPKVLSVSTPEKVQQMMPLLQEHFQGRVTCTQSKAYFLEVVAPGASKGGALRRLAQRIGIRPENTLVFGDSLNDISMLQFGPYGVAVGNARPVVQQAAWQVCLPNTQDGEAHFINEHVLGGAIR